VYGVAQRLHDADTDPVASGLGYRKAAGRQDDRINLDGRRTRNVYAPAAGYRCNVLDQRIHLERGAGLRGELQESIANVACLVGDGKKFLRFRLFDEGDTQVLLEEGDLLAERPRADDVAQRVR